MLAVAARKAEQGAAPGGLRPQVFEADHLVGDMLARRDRRRRTGNIGSRATGRARRFRLRLRCGRGPGGRRRCDRQACWLAREPELRFRQQPAHGLQRRQVSGQRRQLSWRHGLQHARHAISDHMALMAADLGRLSFHETLLLGYESSYYLFFKK